MSQDEDADEDEVEEKTERTDYETVKNDKNTTNPPGDEIKEEKPTAAKKTTKHLSQAKPKPKSDTDLKQRPQVQNNLQTQHSAPPSTDAKLTLLTPAETETDAKMDTEQAQTETNKTNNPQKKVKRKSVTTPTKETKLNPIKTKRKSNRSETLKILS